MLLDFAPILPIALALVLAFGLGLGARLLRLPAPVGYVVAGLVAGLLIAGPGGRAAATGLAEAGLVLAMFGLGLQVSLRDVLALRLSLVPAALLAGAGTLALGLVLAMALGWPMSAGLIVGLALSAPSLLALVQGLDERHLRDSARGHAIMGWGLVTSLAMVLALVLLPALAGTDAAPRDPFVGVFARFTGLAPSGWIVAALVAVKLAAFIGFMIVVGRRVVPWGLERVAATGSRELSRLALLALAVAVAIGAAYLFGAGLALGAFFAGMILGEDALAGRASRAVLPLREAYAVPFFVGVGMLVEPGIFTAAPLPLLGALLVVVVGRPVLALLAGTLTRQPIATLVPVAAALAQIGEFALLLVLLGAGLGLLPGEGRDLVIAAMALSLIVNPALVRLADMLRPRLEAGMAVRRPGVVLPNRVEPALAGAAAPAEPEVPASDAAHLPTARAGHAVLVGYGAIGVVVADGLKRQGTPVVVIEAAEPRVAAALAAGHEAFAGNAAAAEPQALANVAGAKLLIVTLGDAIEAGQVVARARRLSPALAIVARAQDAAAAEHLRARGAGEVITGTREIGLGLLGWTNGENAHEVATVRDRESFEAVAAALKLDELAPEPLVQAAPEPLAQAAPEPVEPVLSVAALEAAVAAAALPTAPRARAEGPASLPGMPFRPAGE